MQMQEENASAAVTDFTFAGHTRDISGLKITAVWYDLQKPEYQEFLGKVLCGRLRQIQRPIFRYLERVFDVTLPKTLGYTCDKHLDLGERRSNMTLYLAEGRNNIRRLCLRITRACGGNNQQKSIRSGLALIKEAEKHDVLG